MEPFSYFLNISVIPFGVILSGGDDVAMLCCLKRQELFPSERELT